MSTDFNILFVCTGNTCRSPMAEGALRKLLENKNIVGISVSSAGTGAVSGYPATDFAIEAARIWDADITEHRARQLTDEIINNAGLILAMSPGHCHKIVEMVPGAAEKTYLLKNYPDSGCVGEGIEDPIGASLDFYNKTFLDIGEELGRILPDIINTAGSKGIPKQEI